MRGGSRSRCLAFVLAAAVLAPVAPASADTFISTFSNSTTLTVGTGGPPNVASTYPANISVTGLPGQVADVNVTLNAVTHSRASDIGVVLVGPTGRAILLDDGAGNPVSVTNATTILDDQAATFLPQSATWTTGSFRPTAYFQDTFPSPAPSSYGNPGPIGSPTTTLDATFAGTNPNGTWSLYFSDFVNGSGGSISGWSVQITTDTTPPDTTIDTGPTGAVSGSDATFTFSANKPSTFECKLDGAAFAPCSAPKTYPGLADGAHTVQVRAIDAAKNVDATPATRVFTVDTVAPTTSIDSGPSGVVADPNVSFGFSVSEAANLECALDGGTFGACTSPQAYTGLADGLHVFQLRAKDLAGNVDATGASRAFTVQTTPVQADSVNPTTAVTKPKVKAGKTKVRISFSGSDNTTAAQALQFTCSLDGKAAAPCTSPATYKHLKVGTHSFFVVAQDAAGNLSAPASTTFRVKPHK